MFSGVYVERAVPCLFLHHTMVVQRTHVIPYSNPEIGGVTMYSGTCCETITISVDVTGVAPIKKKPFTVQMCCIVWFHEFTVA